MDGLQQGKTPLWNQNFTAICFISFFLFMTFYILAVALPLFVTGDLGRGEGDVGLVMTVFVLAAVVIRPFAGNWMNRFDRKKLFLGSLLLFLVCSAAYVMMHDYWTLIGLRTVHGIGFGLAATAGGALAADLVPESRKGEGIGYYSLFMSTAMVLGPFIGLTVAGRYGMQAMFLMCTAFGVISFVWGFVLRIPKRVMKPHDQAEATGWRKYFEPASVPVSLAAAFVAFSYGGIATFISMYANKLGIGAYAGTFFIVFAAAIILPRPLTGRWFDRHGGNVLVYPGILLFTVGMVALSQAYAPWSLLLAGAVIGLGYGVLVPSLQTLAIQAAERHRGALATSTYFVFFDSGYGIGSFALGTLVAGLGFHGMYLIAGLIVACTAIVYFLLVHRRSVSRMSTQTLKSEA